MEKSATLTTGKAVTLTPTITPKDATNKELIWASNNTEVATVNNGKVNVIVKHPNLNKEQISQIQNIVERELNVTVDDINIGDIDFIIDRVE